MRNLTLIRHQPTGAAGVRAACWRQDHLVTACCVDGRINIHVAQRQVCTIALAELGGGDDEIVSLHHNAYDDRLCLFARKGDIVEIDLKRDGAHQVIGTVDEEIEAVSWAYDGDVVAITTMTTLSVLTRRFDPVAEVKYKDTDIKASANQVSVGWGRSDTQFKGKHAKGHAPRDPTLPEKVDAGTLSPLDDGRMRLSWRGDGQCLAVSSVCSGRRVIRVYTRDGVLESTSEPIDGHEGSLSWRPWGNIIATTKRSDAGVECIFFEKNGLRHGEFTLRSQAKVIELGWNCDSTCLAVQTEDAVEFWVSSNYKYALKARIPLTAGAHVDWHTTKPLSLLVTEPTTGQAMEIDFRWQVLTHEPVGKHDYGLVARIDGCELGLTPLRLANVPPPMSLRTLMLPAEEVVPRHISISARCRYICVLYSASVALYEWDLATRPLREPGLLQTWKFDAGRAQAMQCAVNDERTTRVLLSDHSVLHVSSGDSIVKQACEQALNSAIVSGDSFYLHSTPGQVLTDDFAEIAAFGQSCPDFAVTEIDGQMACFGLTNNGVLYAQEHPLATGITSFLLVDRFLMYTTTTHVNFVHLNSNLQLPVEGANDERSRQIDRGSLLVCSCPTNKSVILQAPRGNLETIYPRLLVLSGIRRAVRDRDWASAWRDAKVHRIDSNLLYDLDAELFLAEVQSFVSGLGTSTELDLFLSTLREDDVTKTMYIDTLLQDGNISVHKPNPQKVNTICDAVLACLTKHCRETHLSSILTAHLCKTPRDYDAALHLVTSLTDAGEKEDALTHMCFIADVNELYNQALGIYDLRLALAFAQKSPEKDPREYVPFLQGMQKLPQQRMRYTLNNHLKRYERALVSLLDMRGTDEVSDALWEECLAYTQKHELWSTALQHMRYSEDWLQKLLPYYAEYLIKSSDQSGAARIFELCGRLDRAADSYRSAGRWREALYAARLSPDIDDEGVETLAEDLVSQLESTQRYAEAGRLCRDVPIADIDRAIDFFCRAYDYTEALSLMTISHSPARTGRVQERIEKLIQPRLREHMASQRELLAEMRTQLDSQVPRLREVRKRRREDPIAFFDGTLSGGGHAGLDDSPTGAVRDDVSLAAGSEATTTVSLFTRYTGISRATGVTPSLAGSNITGITGAGARKRSSIRLARRIERQRAKGKKGTVWEEEYLINSVARLCARLDDTRDEIRSVVVAAFRLDHPVPQRTPPSATAASPDAVLSGVDSLSLSGDAAQQAGGATGNWRREAAALQRAAAELYTRARTDCDEVFDGVLAEMPDEIRAGIAANPLLRPFDLVLDVF